MNKGEKLEEALRPVFERWDTERDLKARAEIIESFVWLAAYVARHYSGKGHDFDDLYQTGCLGLCKAVDRYNLATGPFCAFAYVTIKGEILHLFKYDKPVRGAESVLLTPDPGKLIEPQDCDEIEQVGVREVVQQVLDGCTDREKRIINMLIDGNTQRQVADELGTHQMEISRIYKKFRAAVRRELYES